jgi:hypothetical protein
LQNNHVYSAASLIDVLNLLKQYRLSGILTIRRVSDPFREEVRISVENGQPVQIQRGSRREEQATPTVLSRLYNQGMIYFTFQAIEPTLRLPAPQTPPSPNGSAPEASRVTPDFSPTVTRPLPRVSPEMVRDQAGFYNTQHSGEATMLPGTPTPGMPATKHSPAEYSSTLLFDEPIPRLALEMAIASLTPTGRNYPIAQIPRYDRTIYLLIDGRRTIANLAHLTNRSVEEVCNSLYRLKQQELIVIRL